MTAVADYAGNPYPGQLFDHDTGGPDDGDHATDWEDQPEPRRAPPRRGSRTPCPPAGDTPISPAYTEANIGETQNLTITLEDVYGNPIAGRQVEWFMQGVGFFVTDDDNTISDPTDPAGNKDFDVTDENGQARLMVKSFDAGEQIIHAKVRDKGIGGNEGQFTTYDAEVQWFDVNVVTFDDPTTAANEAVSSNEVGTTHDFTLNVMGLKLELDPNIDNPAAQTPFIDTDAAGSSYDGVFDAKDAAYLGGILLVNPDDLIKGEYTTDDAGIDPDQQRSPIVECVQGRNITLSFIGGYTKFDWNHDGYVEDFEGQTGIYLPLQGKMVAFDKGNGPDTPGDESPLSVFTGKSNLDSAGNPASFDGLIVDGVGTVSPASAVTDANGQAMVTVASTVKGPETVRAIVDWVGNPHNQSELVKAFAKKAWVAQDGTGVDISVSIEGTKSPTTLTARSASRPTRCS